MTRLVNALDFSLRCAATKLAMDGHTTFSYSASNNVEAELVLQQALMSWSGGKDSALALYEIQHGANFRVAALLTTLTRDYDRISMHGVRRVLLERQAASLGLPLHQIFINKGATNQEYE